MDGFSDEYFALSEHIDSVFDDESEKCFSEEMFEEDAFQKIPEDKRLHINPTVCAILYIMNLVENPETHNFTPAHDQLFLASLSDLKSCSDEDIKYLMRCGVQWQEESFFLWM